MAGKRANGEGGIYPDGNGWKFIYPRVRDPITGKIKRRSEKFETREEARKRQSEVTHTKDIGTFLEPSKMTVGQWLDIWTNTYLGSIKPRTKDLYTDQVKLHLKPTLGWMKLQALTAPSIQLMYKSKLEGKMKDGKITGALMPKTIKNLHGILHKALDQAVKLGYIRFNPADACDLPRVEKPDIHPLQGESLTAFLNEIKEHRYEHLFMVALLTGMREGELLGLQWDTIDFDKGTIKINKQLQRRTVDKKVQHTLAPTKNDKPRTIKPAKTAMDCLRRLRKTQAEWKLLSGGGWDSPLNLVFTHEDGRHIAVSTICHAMKRVSTAIDRPNLRFHDLRHTYATLSLQNGVDIKTLSESLGHATVAFTMDIYAHVTDAMQQAAADKMEAFIQAQM